MNPRDLRIVFMGTPAIAAFILEAILGEGYQVVGVVTAPDKPAGRGLKIHYSDVKVAALKWDLPIQQPTSLKSPEFQEALQGWKPDVQVVVAFRMLPESVWALPPMGTFNMHASLLPQYRGAAPINWAIINGETETGVTTFLLDREIDTGKILFREKIPVGENETAGQLHDRIQEAGAAIVMKTLDALASGKAKPLDQEGLITNSVELKKAPKIFKEDCQIDWNQPCQQVVNLIHGLSPYPGAFTTISHEGQQTTLKIFEARAKQVPHAKTPGTLFSDGKSNLMFATPDGLVLVNSLQMAGKKRMNTSDFLRGFRAENLRSFPQ
ncbi:MAG: methionyl-tRNA formyltransferase [Bacteroides sp.]|jgi:methionyl-tRNA formyltransferase|nr:methionyl-tRNA formyltransferase [Bacteroides sp.]